MQKRLLHVALTLLLVTCACSFASAAVFFDTLTSTETPQILNLTCSISNPVDSVRLFTYDLANPIANSVIVNGFTLQFPGVPTDDFVVTQTPTGWFSAIVPSDNKINWRWNFANAADQLNPGETFRFAFTSSWPLVGESVVNAAAINGFGFSGKTCGPVIPEPTTVMLGLMGLGSVVGLRRFRK